MPYRWRAGQKALPGKGPYVVEGRVSLELHQGRMQSMCFQGASVLRARGRTHRSHLSVVCNVLEPIRASDGRVPSVGATTRLPSRAQMGSGTLQMTER